MRNKITLILASFAFLVFSNAALAVGEAQSDKTVSGFVGVANQITDWFKYLSTAYDEIIKNEKQRQLIIRVEHIAKELYRLETARADFIESLLKTKNPDLSVDEKRVLIDIFNTEAWSFQKRVWQVQEELRKFGADLREHGVQGQEVERIIHFGLNYGSVLDGGSLNLNGRFSDYGPTPMTDVSFNEKELLEENKRCIKALKAAQIAASEFLEHLKQ